AGSKKEPKKSSRCPRIRKILASGGSIPNSRLQRSNRDAADGLRRRIFLPECCGGGTRVADGGLPLACAREARSPPVLRKSFGLGRPHIWASGNY
ncbi:MAG: hypothetical protein AAFQ78_02480, partial [Bacteroidota bacterium]